MISLGDALLKLGVDSSDLEKSMAAVEKLVGKNLDQMGKKFLKVGAVVTAMGTAIVAGLWKMTDSYTKAGDEVAKMAKRTGLGVETLSEMRHVAAVSGTSLGGLEVGIRKMQSTIVDAGDGLEMAARGFKKLGLNIEDIRAMTPEQQFWTIAQAIADIKDPTLRAALAVDMFGRSGTNMLPMLAEGSEGIAHLRQEAHDLNIVFSDETAAAAEAFQDAQTRMKESLQGLGATMAKQLMPIFSKFIEKITAIIKVITEWIKVHPGLAENLLKLGVILVAGGMILMGLGALAKAIVAVNAALIIMHSLTGVGLIKLAASLAIAAASIYGMTKLIEGATAAPKLPSMQFGGIVPGPIGQPIPIMAHGGETYLGLQNMGKSMGNNITVNLGVLPGDDVTIRRVVQMIKDILGEDSRRNSFGQVNRGYFYGRSSV